MKLRIDGIVAADADAVIALNTANEPDVGPMDEGKLDLLLGEAALVRVVRDSTATVVGALFVLVEGAAYPSPNYAWFGDRHEAFTYVDRIMLAPSARGHGLGPTLYDEASTFGRRSNRAVLCAEVNTVPPNPRSLRFHELYGFREVGRLRPYGPDEEVALLELRL